MLTPFGLFKLQDGELLLLTILEGPYIARGHFTTKAKKTKIREIIHQSEPEEAPAYLLFSPELLGYLCDVIKRIRPVSCAYGAPKT